MKGLHLDEPPSPGRDSGDLDAALPQIPSRDREDPRIKWGGLLTGKQAAELLHVSARLLHDYRTRHPKIDGIPVSVKFKGNYHFTAAGIEAVAKAEDAMREQVSKQGEVIFIEAMHKKYGCSSDRYNQEANFLLHELGIQARDIPHPLSRIIPWLALRKDDMERIFAKIDFRRATGNVPWTFDEIDPEGEYRLSTAAALLGCTWQNFAARYVERQKLPVEMRNGSRWVKGSDLLSLRDPGNVDRTDTMDILGLSLSGLMRLRSAGVICGGIPLFMTRATDERTVTITRGLKAFLKEARDAAGEAGSTHTDVAELVRAVDPSIGCRQVLKVARENALVLKELPHPCAPSFIVYVLKNGSEQKILQRIMEKSGERDVLVKLEPEAMYTRCDTARFLKASPQLVSDYSFRGLVYKGSRNLLHRTVVDGTTLFSGKDVIRFMLMRDLLVRMPVLSKKPESGASEDDQIPPGREKELLARLARSRRLSAAAIIPIDWESGIAGQEYLLRKLLSAKALLDQSFDALKDAIEAGVPECWYNMERSYLLRQRRTLQSVAKTYIEQQQ